MSIHIFQYVNSVHDIQNVIWNQVSTWCIHPSLYISIHWKQTSMTTRHASSYSNDKNRKQNWMNKVLLRKLWTKKPDKSKLPTLRKICNITFPWVTSTGSFSTSMEKLCTETGQVAEKSKVCREGDAASAVDASSSDFLRIQKGDKMIFIYKRCNLHWNNIDITQHITLKLPLK